MLLADAVLVPARFGLWRDILALGKPRLSMLVLCTTGVGLWLAPGSMPWPQALCVLFATATVVGAANAFNSYLERDIDALMRRTSGRPLPAGRLDPQLALWLSIIVASVSLLTLYWLANPLTALLAFAALAIYSFVYTPMKRCSCWALLVGAVPGAIPPLLGWAAITGDLSAPGWVLFGVLFFWQLPHFLAIAIYLKDDYRRGGLPVFSQVQGPFKTMMWLLISIAVLVPVSMTPMWVNLAGKAYGAGAFVLSTLFFSLAYRLRPRGPKRLRSGVWGRQVFVGSIAYLTVLLAWLLAVANVHPT